MWEDTDSEVHDAFWDKLLQERAEMFENFPEFLRSLRFNYKEAERMQRMFGRVWASRNTNIYKLIARACGEVWDDEDDEKAAYARSRPKKDVAIKQSDTRRPNDDLVGAREKGARRRQHELQGVPETRQRLLEEAEGGLRLRGGSSSPPKEKARPQKESRRRRADFYRRAGGTCS